MRLSLTPALAKVLFLALATGTSPTHAQTETPPTYDRVTLTVSAEAEVENDLLVAVLFAQAEGREAAAPADEVNRIMDWAVSLSRSHPEVKVQTLGYRTQPVYNKNNIRAWRVNQSLRLEARDGRLLGDLVAKLQEQLQLQSIGYELSSDQRRTHLDELTDAAMQRFQERARHIAKSLGRGGYRIVRVNINDGYRGPAPIARGMMMEAAAADVSVAPARIEAGTQQVTVSINAEIELNAE